MRIIADTPVHSANLQFISVPLLLGFLLVGIIFEASACTVPA
jgi:hypothetical protein